MPKWLLVIEPGPTSQVDFSSLGTIPSETRMVIVVGEDDHVAGEAKAKLIWSATGQIPPKNRDYVRVRSDRRGVWAAGLQPEQTAACETPVPFFKPETSNIVTCATAIEAWTFHAIQRAAQPAAPGRDDW